MTTTAPQHDTHEHPRFLAHHFDTPQQQFDSGKLGIWLFLTTEILLFSGLFCAYAVYRAIHPEVFEYAHQYLDKTMGAINTIVLIFSSFTMAYAVRAAQTGQQTLLKIMLSITILCGATFMGVKYVEYKQKFHHQTLWGDQYNPTAPPSEHTGGEPVEVVPATEAAASAPATAAAETTHLARTPDGAIVEVTALHRAAPGNPGVNPDWISANVSEFKSPAHVAVGPEPHNTQLFFSVYFLMTGLHGLHVLAGMAVIGWILKRSFRGDFGPDYFNPVDFVGLYWHVVDLVWIFLFPLLYLIT